MIETGVVVTGNGPVHWHLPEGRTGGSLPDSRTLWDVLWEHRREPFLGFAHSHPGSGVPGPSWTDVTTFSGVEIGLGRRLTWWITSATHMIGLNFEGPGKYDYRSFLVDDVPEWARKLRELSDKETTFLVG
jgi:hypothetical protein